MPTSPKSNPPPEGCTRLTVNLATDIHRQFKATTAAEGTDMGTVAEGLIKEWLAKRGIQ